jgi:hypothetical protein
MISSNSLTITLSLNSNLFAKLFLHRGFPMKFFLKLFIIFATIPPLESKPPLAVYSRSLAQYYSNECAKDVSKQLKSEEERGLLFRCMKFELKTLLATEGFDFWNNEDIESHFYSKAYFFKGTIERRSLKDAEKILIDERSTFNKIRLWREGPAYYPTESTS